MCFDGPARTAAHETWCTTATTNMTPTVPMRPPTCFDGPARAVAHEMWCATATVRLDRVSNDGYKSCRGLRIYSQALLWSSASCRALRSLSDLSLDLSSNATTLNHLIRLRGSQGIQIWKQRTH